MRESLQLSCYSGSSSTGSPPATSTQRSPSRKAAPKPVAGTPAQLQEQPPDFPRNKKRKDVHFLLWAHILRMDCGGSFLKYAVLDYTQSRLGGLWGCWALLPAQTTKQERFTVGWQWWLHLLVLPSDQKTTGQMLTRRGFNQAWYFEVFPELWVYFFKG